MMIKNYKQLATSYDKKIALSILESGLGASNPASIIGKTMNKNKIFLGKETISLLNYKKILLVSFGKAADSMARAVSSLIKVDGGVIVIPQGVKSQITNKKFDILHGGHPIPNNGSLQAAKKILNFLQKRKKDDFVIFLISGGGSSLVAMPDGITLDEKKSLTNLLIRSGATIHEINCIRKHLSKIKGGKMAEALQCDAISVILSDVAGNDISDIASGPTYFDNTTFEQAEKILEKYNLKRLAPQNILKRIDLGKSGKIPETPKHEKIKNYVIATNKNCIDAMVKKAKQLGFATKTLAISGNVRNAAKKLSCKIPKKQKSCLIFGGETTVKVIGNGKGGRNQELVLYVLSKVKSNQNILVASMGTDGKDGNSRVAGALLENLEFNFIHAQKFLKNNDSYNFLKKHNGIIFTGPTHTNLMDIGLMLRP